MLRFSGFELNSRLVPLFHVVEEAKEAKEAVLYFVQDF